MTREEFLEKMQDVLQMEETLKFDAELSSLEEWDSLAMMATTAFIDKNFSMKLFFDDFKAFKTVEDIAKKVGL